MRQQEHQQLSEMDNNDRKRDETTSLDSTVQHKASVKGRINNDPLPLSNCDLNLKFAEDTNRIDERASPTSMSIEGSQETVRLPATFGVKFLGKREARGLWGIKFTRKPVDDMVALAKNLKPGTSLPHLHFKVDSAGVTISEMPDNRSRDFETGFYPVDIISYGVQDVVYTRVFSMIVVRDTTAISPSALMGGTAAPFECYAYVCDSRQSARTLTIALATAFQEFSKTVKNQKTKHKRIAIDLRTPEQMAADCEDQETEA
ncbi:uncharacterized protein LOC116921877 [Daphnia magna]|uniref:uncharacterized protein LOC116921877 n=1 Tax=Daphnia magna TaxID=35525 RepID=UPI001E1BA6E6|nr:uncharacterized protein LOC116921877 [Daphnia magna]